MKRLPLITERALGEVKALQIAAGHSYELQMRINEPRTSCKKGCTSCCSHPFLISIAEGLILYRWLRENRKWTPQMRAAVMDARDKTLGLLFDIWLLSNIPCPLLNTAGECSAYEARPLRCRITYSTGAPQQCRPNELGPKTKIVPYADTLIEFTRASLDALKKAGAKSHLMPLGEALLLAEAIDTGKLDIKDTDTQHGKDLMNG